MKEYFYLSEKAKKNTLRKITSVLKKRPEIVFAYCHGSFLLKGIKFRDIDIAVYLKEDFKTDIFDYEQKIGDLLERKIKYPVDVKVLNITPFYFLNNVFRTGKLLFSQNDDLLVKLIESSSIEAIANYDFSLQSLKELIS